MSTTRLVNVLTIFGWLALGAALLQCTTSHFIESAWMKGFFLLVTAGALLQVIRLRGLLRRAGLTPPQMRAVFDNATEGIILTNDKGGILLVNPAIATLFDYSPEELRGQPIELLIPGRFHDGHSKYLEHFNHHPANRGMGMGRNIFARKKGGREFAVEITLGHYREKKELYFIAFLVDITERRLVDQELVERRSQLELINKNVNRLHAEIENKVEQRTLILRDALQELEHSQAELSRALQEEKEQVLRLQTQLKALRAGSGGPEI